MRLYDIAELYTVRLKARVVLVQELFAVVGIAVGVALLFASQVASASLNGSVSQLTNGIVGQSQYQLQARGPEGFSEKLLGEVRALPGVRAAVPVLEHEASVIGPTGREQAVDMIATDPRYVHLAGPLLRHLSAQQLAGQRALALPAPVAHAIGASSLEPIKVQIGTSIVPSLLATILQSSEIGPLVHSPVALAPLAYAQTLTGMPGRVTRIFVQALPGKTAQVHAGLVQLAASRLNVEPGNFDSTLFAQAATPINQSTQTFAAICALVGFMFAFCSMLLTMHLRQGLVRELRLGGATRWEAVKALLFDALILGSLASLLGLALGDLLSILVFGSNPGYLSFAFPVGSQRIVTWQSVAIAAGAGFLAACVGVLTPLRDIWTRARRTDIPSEPGALTWWTAATLAGGLACLGVTTAILFAAPQSAIVGIVTLILALFLLLPLLIDAIVWLFDRIQRPIGAGSTEIAVVELRSPKTRVRSVAIAATGDSRVRQRHDPGIAHQPSGRAEPPVPRHNIGHGSVGCPTRSAEPAGDHTFSRWCVLDAGASSRCECCRALPCFLPGIRRASRMGAGTATDCPPSSSGRADFEGRSRAGEREAARGRLGGHLQDACRPAPPPHR